MMWSSGLAPELVWGLIPRFVGVLYVFAFVPIILQHASMPGARGGASISLLLADIRRDFPGFRRFLDHPTLFWLNSSDAAVRWASIVGSLAGLVAIYGGPFAFYALLLAWMLWLSQESRGLLYPWDTMLQEVGFLVLFLPAVHALPDLHASALPLPSVAFMLRWFVLRLMLGFGKDKFIGTRWNDSLYLRGFFVWMPLPTPLGWFAHHLPAWMLRVMLGFMFVAEVIAPILGLFSGPIRIVSFAILSGLMVGIHITGNWGFFNIGYVLLAVSLLDIHGSIFDLAREPWVSSLGHWPDLAVHAAMALLFLISLIYLPNNSWFTRTWLHWPADMFPLENKWMPWSKAFYRAMTPLRAISGLRLVSGYGVFPPHAMPPVRLVPAFEGSDDGVHWKQYGYKHMPSFSHSRPPFIAPYHARLDQYVYYVTMGIDSGSLFGSLFPYAGPHLMNTRATSCDIVVQGILMQDARTLNALGHNPFPDAAPKLVRVSVLGMTPTRLSELRATGQWWHVRRFGQLLPPRGVESWPVELIRSVPELFHPDMVEWRQRSKSLRDLVAAYRSGMPVEEAVIAGTDLTAADVAQFWNELVPMLAAERGTFSRIHARADAVRARFDVPSLYRLERVHERFVWLLRQGCEHHRFGLTQPSLPVMSNFRFHMLMHECVIDGREACLALLADPSRVVERAERSTDATQIWALSIFRYEQVMAHVATFRGSEMGLQSREQGLPSFFEYYDLLVTVVPPGEEFFPRIHKHANGEHTIDGFYPPPPLRLPPAAGTRRSTT